MKKQLSYVLLLASVFAMAGCDNTSNGSQQPSPSVKPTPVFDIPTSIDQIKANVEATKFKGYSFEDDSSKKASGTVSFNKNEILVKGTASFEDEGSLEKSDLLMYRGFNNSTFYDIETYLGKHAKRKNIVSEVTDEKVQILLDDAKKELDNVTYNKNWFQNNISKILVEGATFTSKSEDDFYKLTISYVSGHTVNNAVLSFDEDNQLVEGSMVSSTWPSDNFDEEKKAPIDPDQKPSSSSSYKATFVLGEDNKEEITFDVSKYYVTSIDEFYVSSYSDKEKNDGKAKAGDYVDLRITKFSPSTALNVDEFKIVESSDPTVIEINSITGSAKAVKAGESTLTISDPIGSFKVTKKVTVTSPSLNSIWISITNKTLKVNDTATIKIEAYPTESDEELEAISSDPTVVKIGEISADRKSLSIKGLKEGTSNITVRSKNNPDVTSRALTITVEKKQDEESKWLIGTWTHKVTGFDTTFTFNANGTGSVTQDAGVAVPNEATFNWSYDGTNIKFSDWYSEEGLLKTPTNISVSEDKESITLTMKSTNEDGYSEDVEMTLTKAMWLVGTWVSDDEDLGKITIVLNKDGTGTIKQGTKKSYNLTWSYDDKKLSFPKDGWKWSSYSVSSVISISEQNEKFVIRFEDDYDYYQASFTKAQ